MIRHALGHQLAVELYGCDPSVLDDVEAITRLMLEAAEACGATIVGHELHRFSPQGVSGVVIIAESHLAIHTWPEHRYAAVDLFTCGTTVRPRLAVEHLRRGLAAESLKVAEVRRGLPTRPGSSAATTPPDAFRYGPEFVESCLAPALAAPRPEDARSLVTELADQVYLLPLFTPAFCERLVEAAEARPEWVTPFALPETPHSSFADVADSIESETMLPLEELPGAVRLWDEVVRLHLQPVLEGLWSTFRLERWDAPVVRRYEPSGVSRMGLHHDTEAIGLIGYLNAGFAGGGTHFPRWGLTVGDAAGVRPGSVIVHPGGVSHAHLAHPVTAGRRYTLAASFH